MTLDFEKLEDGCDLFGPFRLIRRFGWFKGNYFLQLMESYIEKKTRMVCARGMRATFRDLVEHSAATLRIEWIVGIKKQRRQRRLKLRLGWRDSRNKLDREISQFICTANAKSLPCHECNVILARGNKRF